MKCPKCGKNKTVKRGKRYNKFVVKQLYFCYNCNLTYVKKDGFERMRTNKKIIAKAIHLHNDGLSLFQITNYLWQHEGIKVTRRTISQWIKKYSVFLKSDK